MESVICHIWFFTKSEMISLPSKLVRIEGGSLTALPCSCPGQGCAWTVFAILSTKSHRSLMLDNSLNQKYLLQSISSEFAYLVEMPRSWLSRKGKSTAGNVADSSKALSPAVSSTSDPANNDTNVLKRHPVVYDSSALKAIKTEPYHRPSHPKLNHVKAFGTGRMMICAIRKRTSLKLSRTC